MAVIVRAGEIEKIEGSIKEGEVIDAVKAKCLAEYRVVKR